MKNRLKFIIALFLVFLFFFSFLPPSALAKKKGLPTLNFGGKLLAIFTCTNGGLLLAVGPPSPGLFVFQIGKSKLFEAYSLKPGNLVLGNYTVGGVCVVGLFPVPVWGTVKNVGTSFKKLF